MTRRYRLSAAARTCGYAGCPSPTRRSAVSQPPPGGSAPPDESSEPGPAPGRSWIRWPTHRRRSTAARYPPPPGAVSAAVKPARPPTYQGQPGPPARVPASPAAPGTRQGPPPGYQQPSGTIGSAARISAGPPPGYQQGPPPGYQQGPPPGYQVSPAPPRADISTTARRLRPGPRLPAAAGPGRSAARLRSTAPGYGPPPGAPGGYGPPGHQGAYGSRPAPIRRPVARRRSRRSTCPR